MVAAASGRGRGDVGAQAPTPAAARPRRARRRRRQRARSAIAYIDVQRVLARSAAGVAAREQLEREKAAMQKEMDGKRVGAREAPRRDREEGRRC